ncbi:MAG TPA: FAD-dependent oxidoreductase [Terriglobia bacterium]|nr:FAD-dependent oxidoreductase [Terriglobia bacterium]
MHTAHHYDVAVIGAGCFGAWMAFELQKRGQRVILLDAYGPASSRSSSGGESRIMRMGYGADEIYTRWAMRALPLWQEFFERVRQPLFHQTGVLWLAHEGEKYNEHNLAVFKKLGVPHERLSRRDIEKRYPQFSLDPGHAATQWKVVPLRPVTGGILEPESGVVLARRAVQAVVEEAVKNGVEYLQAASVAPTGKRKLSAVTAQSGTEIHAGTFVFACGPWLPKLFPELLGGRIFPTRQEVFFFGAPAGDARFMPPAMPTWINLGDEHYGMPSLEHRGVKIAFDRHGARFDPDTGKRVASSEGLQEVREYLGARLPALRDAPVVETRVCQYENTSNGDFLVDRHPDFDNVWLVGGGSGHGFKHGPVMGEYVTAQVLDGGPAEPRFSLATKAKVQHRSVF